MLIIIILIITISCTINLHVIHASRGKKEKNAKTHKVEKETGEKREGGGEGGGIIRLKIISLPDLSLLGGRLNSFSNM